MEVSFAPQRSGFHLNPVVKVILWWGKAVGQAHPHPFQRESLLQISGLPRLGEQGSFQGWWKGLALGRVGHKAMVTDSLMPEAQ